MALCRSGVNMILIFGVGTFLYHLFLECSWMVWGSPVSSPTGSGQNPVAFDSPLNLTTVLSLDHIKESKAGHMLMKVRVMIIVDVRSGVFLFGNSANFTTAKYGEDFPMVLVLGGHVPDPLGIDVYVMLCGCC